MSKFIEKLISKKWFKVLSTILVFGLIFILNIFIVVMQFDVVLGQSNSVIPIFALLLGIFIIFLAIIEIVFISKYLIKNNSLKVLEDKLSSNICKNISNRLFYVICGILLLLCCSIESIFILYSGIGGIINIQKGVGASFGIDKNIVILSQSFLIVLAVVFFVLIIIYFAFLIKKLLQKPKEELQEDVNKELNE